MIGFPIHDHGVKKTRLPLLLIPFASSEVLTMFKFNTSLERFTELAGS